MGVALKCSAHRLEPRGQWKTDRDIGRRRQRAFDVVADDRCEQFLFVRIALVQAGLGRAGEHQDLVAACRAETDPQEQAGRSV